MNSKVEGLKLLHEGLLKMSEGIEKLINSEANVQDAAPAIPANIIPMEVPAPAKAEKSAPAAKPAKSAKPAKVALPAEEPEEPEEQEDPVAVSVTSAVADMTNEEIAEILIDAGLSATGKREALVARVIKAVKDGKIEFEDDEEESPAEEEAEEEGNGEFSYNDPTNPDMTDARRTALEALESGTVSQLKSKAITHKEMSAWIAEFRGTDEGLKGLSKEDILSEYINLAALLIDDEGNESESGVPYTVNGIPFCCASPLTHDEESNSYKCEICGGEFEDEE